MDICAQKYGACVPNPVLEALGNNASNAESLVFQYPIMNTKTGPVFLGMTLGGVKTDDNGTVLSAKAIRVIYYLKESEANRSEVWLREFMRVFSENDTDFEMKLNASVCACAGMAGCVTFVFLLNQQVRIVIILCGVLIRLEQARLDRETTLLKKKKEGAGVVLQSDAKG
ncbi:PTHD3 protein, partial [Polypterus senegalus]|nr:PTHD3 protein [Polypterus senegalus]